MDKICRWKTSYQFMGSCFLLVLYKQGFNRTKQWTYTGVSIHHGINNTTPTTPRRPLRRRPASANQSLPNPSDASFEGPEVENYHREVFRLFETNIGGWATQVRFVRDYKSKSRTKPSIFGVYIFLSHKQMALCTCVISKERDTHPLLHVQELNSLSTKKKSNAICLGAAFLYGICSGYSVVYPLVHLLKMNNDI